MGDGGGIPRFTSPFDLFQSVVMQSIQFHQCSLSLEV
jgi:hypothetical protein